MSGNNHFSQPAGWDRSYPRAHRPARATFVAKWPCAERLNQLFCGRSSAGNLLVMPHQRCCRTCPWLIDTATTSERYQMDLKWDTNQNVGPM